MNDVVPAFALTLVAGLSTGIGSLLALTVSHTNRRFLTFALGFSAGIMLYVSFVEILPQASGKVAEQLSGNAVGWATTLAFFGGILAVGLIDRLVPEFENPHEVSMIGALEAVPGGGVPVGGVAASPIAVPVAAPRVTALTEEARLHRMGLFTAGAIAVHNLPEGLVVFFGALSDPSLGIVLAITIALHNIPEGMAVATPIYFATGSRQRAFGLSFLSGLAEPLGALVGYLLLRPFLSPLVFGVVIAAVGGIMVYISLDELLPAAEEYGEHHVAITGVMLGMAVMAVSLLLLAQG